MSVQSDDVRARLKALREASGLSRRDLAERAGVDLTAVAAWEAGKYLPRDGRRKLVAEALGTTVPSLFRLGAEQATQPCKAALLDTLNELPDVLTELVGQSHALRAMRLAAPYPTPAHVQIRFREIASRRLLAGVLQIQRVEIVYGLERLSELLWNIINYSGKGYWAKVFCAGLKEVAPGMGGYMFDDAEFLIGAYWTGVPPHNRPGLRLSGEPFRTYFNNYWDEIWSRGTLLNIRGSHDLSAVKTVALTLGLPPSEWADFVDQAHGLEVGDGVPPLI